MPRQSPIRICERKRNTDSLGKPDADISAYGHESGLPQRQLPGQTADYVNAYGHHGVYTGNVKICAVYASSTPTEMSKAGNKYDNNRKNRQQDQV